MTWLTFAELDAQADAFDAEVARTPGVDRFCSSTPWILPAQAAFCPAAAPLVFADPTGYVAMMTVPVGSGHHAAVPLEAGWGLAAPFAGAKPEALIEGFFLALADPPTPVDALFLSGLPYRGIWMDAAARVFARNHRLGIGQTCQRRAARIDDGPEGFLGRRSSRFRANLRRAERVAQAGGVVFERHRGGDGEALYRRILAIETRSWKGREGQGIDGEPTCDFYRRIIKRLLARGGLRAVFATRDGADLAFVFGGVVDGTYRGLQVSFDADHTDLSLGNLAQWEMIRLLCEEGVATYDLGTDMPYKRRWAEPGLQTVTLAIMNR
ncbi:MAG: GNAT family N-acetyltransferase [Myxococcales bacterium]|nr:GNAT family N-acetyltransferase [Myxococcales bacterium]